ncbi:hypothetical protein BJX76DRAFT_240858 [Aspergillus varians]
MSQPAEIKSKRPRRFLPEPVETSSRSSKKHQDNGSAKQNVGIRTSKLDPSSSTNEPAGYSRPSQPRQPGRRPGPMRSNNAHGLTAPDTVHTTFTPNTGNNQQRTRRFIPQLMETARHSFRPGNRLFGPESLSSPRAHCLSDANEAHGRMEVSAEVEHESRFSYSSLLRRQETRRHSFRVPDLPDILSSGSEESNEPNSPQLGPLSVTSRRIGIRPDDRKQSRDGQETPILEYILPFPPHPSEHQLKEHALAAFPNEQVYQPVDHFAIDRDEDESPYEQGADVHDQTLEFRITRRASSADLPSELAYLRRHKEEAGMNRRHYLTTRGGRLARRTSKSVDRVAHRDEGWDVNQPLTQLRQAASPPMLGGDLVFPQSLTPETTICEGSHAIGFNEARPNLSSLAGLWSASPCSSFEHDRGGLWNGTCKPENHTTHRTLSPGLITPRHGVEEDGCCEFDESSQAGAPQHQNLHFATEGPRDDLTHTEYTNQEFNDGFVTQIYDYLSLGYPSVARYYDYELSRISGLPVAALRADDLNMDAKGHVGMYDITNRGATNGVCVRWTALRLYIQEWARQHPQMLEAGCYHEAWGVRERKGSWAV